ncbi:hypothetical protein L6164_033997 [Bauhinia variegata]|uniref:Uncharacterized protein n=1 Tax=Bauhinia variegata TaxID=167791 RepID=A0ACB9KTJ8_BAUVA|nr:hypothetical protein L6164_033997 [Bauhinia variegata]
MTTLHFLPHHDSPSLSPTQRETRANPNESSSILNEYHQGFRNGWIWQGTFVETEFYKSTKDGANEEKIRWMGAALVVEQKRQRQITPIFDK